MMSEAEFIEAVAGLGVTLMPDPGSHRDAQYYAQGDPGEPEDGLVRGSISMQEGILLSDLTAGLRVVEFGTGLGVSAISMAYAASAVVTIDPDDWVHQNVKLGGKVRMVKSPDVAGDGFDFAFIDGLHDAENVRRDIEAARQDCRGIS